MLKNSFNEDSNMTEVWKDIKGYEGSYQVSNLGRVKSLERTFIDKIGHKQHTKERILKQFTASHGYLQVDLYNGSSKKKRLVHRLVCEAFHENTENKPCVNHIDENKTNNVASNLEWCTYEENNNHGTHNARSAKTNININLFKLFITHTYLQSNYNKFRQINKVVHEKNRYVKHLLVLYQYLVLLASFALFYQYPERIN